jgi:peptide/nickel transport system substrate-binding protein
MRFGRMLCLVLLAGLVAAACGTGGSRSTNGPPPHGNVLYYAAPGEPDSLDPGAGISGWDAYFSNSIYDTLTVSDPKTTDPKPGLATSWSFLGPNKLTFRMHLRHGVKFQDGTPFNAEAVKISLDHYRSLGVWFDLAPVVSETVVDDYTIDLNLKQQYSVLPAILSFRAGQIVSPTALQKYGKDYGRHPVGTGPFMLKSWTPGNEIDLVRFPDYWNKNAIKLSGITYKIITDATAMTNAVVAGQVDFAAMQNVPATNIPSLQNSNPNMIIKNLPTLSLAIVTTNNNQPPFNDVRVRRAANMAIDRVKLANAMVGKGVSQGPAWEYVPPNYWAYTKDIPNYGYHPDQARQLLAQAGYPNGITVQICTFSSDTTQAATIEKQDMAKAGINLQIVQEPVNSCVAKLQNGGIPMVQIGWYFLASPFQGYQTMFGALNGVPRYPGVDDLLAKIASSYTQQEQKPLYDQLNRLLYQLAPSIPIYFLVQPVAYSKRLHGLVTTINGDVRVQHAYFQ